MSNFLNNLQSVARLTGSTSFVPTPCNAFGVDDALLVGSGISALGGLFSGIFGSNSQAKANKMNYKIWKEQEAFNHNEAIYQRQWQQQMQDMYGTPNAKSNMLRAAGLNAKLGDTSMSQIGSGSSAASPSPPQMQSYNAGADIAQGINNGVQSYLSGYSAETERLSQQSQQSVNDSIVNLNKMRTDTEKLVQNLKNQDFKIGEQTLQQMEANTRYLQNTLDSRIRQQ